MDKKDNIIFKVLRSEKSVLKNVAILQGKTLTDFIKQLIDSWKKDNPEIVKEAQKIERKKKNYV